MVDLDQCTHATINGCDKEQQGWYPLPSSLSPSICLPSCPSRCPLPNCFSLTIAHLHLRWRPPSRRPPCRCRGPADGRGARCALGCIFPTSPDLFRGRTLSSRSVRLIVRSLFHHLLTYPTPLFPLYLACTVSHMLLQHSCSHSLQPCSDNFFPPLLLNALFRMWMSFSDDASFRTSLHPTQSR